jgi:hypothetical protein
MPIKEMMMQGMRKEEVVLANIVIKVGVVDVGDE